MAGRRAVQSTLLVILALAVGFLLVLGSLAELAKHVARRDVVPLVTAAARYSKQLSTEPTEGH